MGAIQTYQPADVARHRKWAGGIDRDKVLWELMGDLRTAERKAHERDGIPLCVGGGTSFSGVETLVAMQIVAAAVGPSATNLSMLTRDCVIPIAPQYFRYVGQHFRVSANGVISTTATVPTYQFMLRVDTAYASPVAGVMLAQNATITPAAAANLDWYLDIVGVVRQVGSGGSILAVGKLLNNWAASATYVITPFKNATPPTAVVENLSLPQFFDLIQVQGAATAGNTSQALDYTLESLN